MSTPGQSHAAWYLSKLSLRQQVFALIVLITLVAGGLKAVSGHHQAREAAAEEAELRAKALLDVSVVMTVDHLKSGEVDRAESAIKDLMAGSGMERVEMQDPARQRVVTFVWQGRPSDASGSRRVVMSVGEQGTLLTEPGPSPHPVEVTVDGATYLWVTRPLHGPRASSVQRVAAPGQSRPAAGTWPRSRPPTSPCACACNSRCMPCVWATSCCPRPWTPPPTAWWWSTARGAFAWPTGPRAANS